MEVAGCMKTNHSFDSDSISQKTIHHLAYLANFNLNHLNALVKNFVLLNQHDEHSNIGDEDVISEYSDDDKIEEDNTEDLIEDPEPYH